MNKRIVIRVDGHKGIGMGHVYRMLTLAKYLRHLYDYEIIFVTRNNKAALDLIESNRFRVYPLRFNASRYDELESLKRVVADVNSGMVVVDLLRRCHEKQFMKKLRSQGNVYIVAFTDVHENREIESDIVINTSFYQNQEDFRHIKGTKYYLGLDYVILPPAYLTIKNRQAENRNHVEKVLICMGGSDHHNLTFTVLKGIDKSDHDFCCDVIVSSAFFQEEKVNRMVKNLRHKVTIYYDQDGILDHLKKADMAITSGGTVHVERMCAGVPGIVINQLRHQCVLSRKASEMGISIDVGFYSAVQSGHLLRAIDTLLKDGALRESMSRRGRKLVDGKGLERVSKIVTEAFQGLPFPT